MNEILPMSLDDPDNVPLCGFESGDSNEFGKVESAAPQSQDLLQRLNKQNSELISIEVLKSKRGRLQRSPSANYQSQLEEEKLLLTKEKAILETKYRNKVAENEQLRAAVYNLEYQLQDIHRDCSAQLSMCHSQIEQKQALIDNLSGDVRDLQDQREALQQKLHDDKRLKEALGDLEKEDGALMKQIRSLTDQLHYFESLAKKQCTANKNLKTLKQDLQLHISEAEYLISNQDEIITQQDREIGSTKEVIEELQIQTREMQETIRDLQHQAEHTREEEVLAVVPNVEEENQLLDKGADSPDALGDTSFQENPAAETPLPENLKNGFWNRCARCLLFGVVTGLSTVGVLRSWDMLMLNAVTYNYYKNSAERLLDCVSQVMESHDSDTHNNFRVF